MSSMNERVFRSDSENFYCYSIRLYHFLVAFDERCYCSKINRVSNNRYWVFKKSDRLDRLIETYNQMKHKL